MRRDDFVVVVGFWMKGISGDDVVDDFGAMVVGICWL